MEFNTLDDLAVKGKRVLVRADLNVPLKDGKVTDATRIERQAPTIRELADKGAQGDPAQPFRPPQGQGGAVDVAEAGGGAAGQGDRPPGRLRRGLRRPKAESAVKALKDGEVLLLENTRFHAGEEKNDPAFAEQVAALGDIFVNDAFSAAHRAHATTTALAYLLPSAAGRAMEAELTHLKKALGDPERPLLAVVGGAKVSTKIELLQNLVSRVEVLVIGGAMANTFLAAEGIAIGKSLYEADHLETARKVVHMATESGAVILLPSDVVVAKEFKEDAAHRTVPTGEIAPDEMVLDVGPATVQAFQNRLITTKTLVWNGPLGAFEMRAFRPGNRGGGESGCGGDQGGRSFVGGGRRRYGRGAGPCGRGK